MATAAGAGTYTTSFPTIENPISEGGLWANGRVVGLDWSNCAVIASGKAVGQQNNSSGPNYNDSTALLTNLVWAANYQAVTGILSSAAAPGGDFPEIELRLMSTMTNHWNVGYEILKSMKTDSSCYYGVVRWDGLLGHFTPLSSDSGIQYVGITNIAATYSNGVIRLYTNSVIVSNLTTNDSTWSSGSPGIGFDHNNGSADDATFWFSSFTASDVLGTNWYVDNSLTNSANTGTSWANAWTNFSSIRFSVFSPPNINVGDTIFISGGPAGSAQVYNGNIIDAGGSSTSSGTAANPITIRTGNDAAHSGNVVINGRISLSKDYWIVNGGINTGLKLSGVLDNYYAYTNVNLFITNTNASQNTIFFQGTGSRVLWCDVALSTTTDDAGIYLSGSGGAIGSGTEIAYNHIHNVNGYAVRGEYGATVVSQTFGQLNVHHNLMEQIGDNFMQFPGFVDFHHNLCRVHNNPDYGHPDCEQEVEVFSRSWDNIFINTKGSRHYVEANDPNAHDILVYNNLYFSSTNYFATWYTNGSSQLITNNPGTSFDVTAHDGGAGTPTLQSNIWYFNNTLYQRSTISTPSAIGWNSSGRTTAFVTNLWYVNNCVVAVAPQNTLPYFQFFTNPPTALYNGSGGYQYVASDVHFDFNNLSGGVNGGNGVAYGNGGAPDLSNYYTNFAAFALSYPQYASNNNNQAAFISLPLAKAYTNLFYPTWDFRPQIGDTALVGKGTNLTTLLSAIAPDLTNDIFGSPRGTAWTIGAVQIPAGYWVATNGSDGNAGTFAAPWRTIQHAANVMTNGDVVNVTIGDYNEYVVTTDNLTATNAHYTFRAYPANDPANPVVTRQFRVMHQNVTVEGLTLTKPTGINGAHVRIEPPNGSGRDGSGCVLTNCTFKDSVKLFTHTASFGSNYIHITSADLGVDFNNAGFVAGMQVFMGSDTPYAYTNCGPANAANAPVVLSNSVDGLTMYFQTGGSVPFAADPGTNYYAWIIAGSSGPTSWYGVLAATGSGGFPSASNLIVTCCTFTNLIGVCIGTGNCGGTNEITYNHFTDFHGGYWLTLNASSTEIAYNLVDHNKNILHWGFGELSNPAFHPSGGQFYDNQCNLNISAQDKQTNVWMHDNALVDCDSEAFELDWTTNGSLFRLTHNLFFGVATSGAINMNGFIFESNTVVRCAYDQSYTSLFGFGNTTNNSLVNGILVGNVFVNNGGHYLSLGNEAPIGIATNTYASLSYSNNLAIMAETMGWTNAGVSAATNLNNVVTSGMLTNNGDPLFFNYANPIDAGYVPGQKPLNYFTGLRPLPNSIIATLGIGALPAMLTNSGPLAHFTLKMPVPGWYDRTITNFDSAWTGLRPDARVDVCRPYFTPELLGTNSATVTVDASQSASSATITNYTATFQPDNVTISTNSPYIPYTFTQGGASPYGVTNTVTLVATANGASSTFVNSFRLLGASSPAVPSAASLATRSATIQLNGSMQLPQQ